MATVGTTVDVRGSDRGCVVRVMDEAAGVPPSGHPAITPTARLTAKKTHHKELVSEPT